jgi:hypothetical protein
MMRLLRSALFLEFGLLLIVLPWSAYWDRNYFAALVPSVREIILNNFVRGGVSGLGVLNLAAGLTELLAVYMARNTATELPVGTSHQANQS